MKNIILIGFMGSGKSTIGRKLSEKYGLKHIDTDWYIEKEQNMKISDIFSKKVNFFKAFIDACVAFSSSPEENQLLIFCKVVLLS